MASIGPMLDSTTRCWSSPIRPARIWGQVDRLRRPPNNCWRSGDRATAAKSTQVMDSGSFNEHTFALDGETLTLTRTRNENGPVENPETIRYTRVR